jgi:hypothetical protein
MKKTLMSFAVIAVLMVATAGCGIEEMFEDLTTREVSISTLIYDGAPTRSVGWSNFAELKVVTAGSQTNLDGDLAEIHPNLIFYRQDVAPELVEVEGQIRNLANSDVSMTLTLVNPDVENSDVYLGTIVVPAGKLIDIAYSNGFEETPDQVEEAIYTFFHANPDLKYARIVADTQGNAGAALKIVYLDLIATPTFRSALPMSGNLAGGYSGNVKSILSVSMTGTVENQGTEDLRFIMVIAKQSQDPNIKEKLIADGIVPPGKKVDVSRLILEEGLPHLKSALKDALDGNNLENNIILISEAKVEADLRSLQVKSELRVGL